jgi:cytochrome c553
MTARIVIFLLLCSFISFFLGIYSYRSYYQADQQISAADIEAIKKQKEESAHAAHEGGEGKPAVAVVEKEFKLVLATEKLKNGYAIYTGKGSCVECHGAHGEGVAAKSGPMVAGQHDWYLVDQITQIQKGIRKNPEMSAKIKGLSAGEIEDVAHFLSQLKIRESVIIE